MDRNIRNYETWLSLVSQDGTDERVIVVRTYPARSKYEAIGKTIEKNHKLYGGYFIKGVNAYAQPTENL